MGSLKNRVPTIFQVAKCPYAVVPTSGSGRKGKSIGDEYTGPPVLLVFCTCPDEETAAEIAEGLVTERFAACVNYLPALTSVYL